MNNTANYGLKFFYFDADHAERLHDWIIEKSGGMPGTKDRNQLESPLVHIQNDDYYPEMADKLAYLIYAINKNHAFQDGNKRASIALGAYFLELNGYDYLVHRFTLEMENIAVNVAANMIDRPLLRRVIESLIYEQDYSEALKLDLIAALSAYEPN